MKCNENVGSKKKRTPVQKCMGIKKNSEYTFTNRCIWRKVHGKQEEFVIVVDFGGQYNN